MPKTQFLFSLLVIDVIPGWKSKPTADQVCIDRAKIIYFLFQTFQCGYGLDNGAILVKHQFVDTDFTMEACCPSH